MNETRTTQPFGPFFPLIFTVAKWICRLLHPVTVQGLENLPRHGALLVANHASNWDPLVLATALPMDYRLRVMGKEELFRNPILAWVIRVGGAFPVNRGGADIQAVKTAIQTIQSGHNLLIFPEGTTIRNGIGKADGLPAHAHSGAAVIGVRTGAIRCRCSWMEKSGPSTGHASSSASPIRRYIPAAGGLLRKCSRSRMSFCGRFTPWAGSR